MRDPILRQALEAILTRMSVSLGQYVCHAEFDRATWQWRDEIEAALQGAEGEAPQPDEAKR
jgi:hypothetical protein